MGDRSRGKPSHPHSDLYWDIDRHARKKTAVELTGVSSWSPLQRQCSAERAPLKSCAFAGTKDRCARSSCSEDRGGTCKEVGRGRSLRKSGQGNSYCRCREQLVQRGNVLDCHWNCAESICWQCGGLEQVGHVWLWYRWSCHPAGTDSDQYCLEQYLQEKRLQRRG